MSIIGTGVAAGVAGTANQAQQAGRAKSARAAAESERAEHIDKLMIKQLRGPGATQDADEEMPDNQQAGYENLYSKADAEREPTDEPSEQTSALDHIHQADAPVTSPSGLPVQATYSAASGLESKAPLLRRIDVKG